MKIKSSIPKLTIDTEMLLKYYLDEPDADRMEPIIENIDSDAIEGFISVITLAEIYYIVGRESETLAEEIYKKITASKLKIVDISRGIARATGMFKLKYSKSKSPLPIADALIAATALVTHTPVLAEDVHFQKINEIEVIDIDYASSICQSSSEKSEK